MLSYWFCFQGMVLFIFPVRFYLICLFFKVIVACLVLIVNLLLIIVNLSILQIAASMSIYSKPGYKETKLKLWSITGDIISLFFTIYSHNPCDTENTLTFSATFYFLRTLHVILDWHIILFCTRYFSFVRWHSWICNA